MAWFLLFLASAFEVTWIVGMKYTEGLTRLWPSVWTLAASLCSFVLLAQSIRTLPVGTAYAVWTGIGTAGSVAFGIYLFSESANPWRLVCIGLIVIGVVGLKVITE